MSLLIIGLMILIGMHLVPAVPPLRAGLVQRLGELTYKGLFAVVSLVGLVLIITGMRDAGEQLLWQPPAWSRLALLVVMAPAAVLLVAAYLPSNIRRVTRHPMLWGVVIWALGHLLANGDAAGIVLFTALLLYALFAMWTANRRGAVKARRHVERQWDFLVIGIGVLVYGLMMMAHGYFGAPVLI